MALASVILEYVYWYPPSSMAPSRITAIGPGLDQYGMVNISFDTETLLGGLGFQNFKINLTPEAYTNWYSAFQEQIPNTSQGATLTSYYQELISTNAEVNTANLVQSNGWQWVPWTTEQVAPNATIQTLEADLLYGIWAVNYTQLGSTSQLYALVNPNYNVTPLIDLSNIPWWAYAIVLGGSLILLLSFILRGGIGGFVTGAVSGRSKASKGSERRAESVEKRAQEKHEQELKESQSEEAKEEKKAQAEYRRAHAKQMRATAKKIEGMTAEEYRLHEIQLAEVPESK